MSNKRNYFDEEVKFEVEGRELEGILTSPKTDGPHPAIVLLHGSDRSGKDDPYYKNHAENIVQAGFTVLRYDGPGWGGGFETLESRTEEAVAVVKYLQSRPDIQANAVGLWGISQGGWICQMAAVAYDGVAFIIPTSGPGVTPAEQEVYRVEAESRAAGFDEDEIAKATLMRRLMVDMVLNKPIYQEINLAELTRLGTNPWDEILYLKYGIDPIDPIVEFEKVLAVLKTIKDKTWTKFLHLDQVIPMFDSMPPQAWEMAKSQMRAVMEVNPADFLTKVRCPVLAIFGEEDTSLPVEKNVELYKKYLREAGNASITIKVFPKASHTIKVNDNYVPEYFQAINIWLSNLTIN